MDQHIPTRVELLIEQIKKEGRCYRGNYPLLARISGLSYSWLYKFLGDTVPTPAFANLVKLERGLRKLRSIDPLACDESKAA